MNARKATVLLALLTLITWGWALFAPESKFWDDWVVFGPDGIGMYLDLGMPWVGYPTLWLAGFGPWAFKLLALVAMAFSACAVYAISGAGSSLGPWQRWLLAALVTVLPLNVTRVSLAVIDTYLVSLAIFLAAWWLLVANPDRRPSNPAAIAAGLLFLLSFTTGSLLVFFALPILHVVIAYREHDRNFLIALVRLAARYWYLALAPLVFWVLRETFFRPSGVYAGFYNEFVELSSPFSLVERGGLLMIATALAGVTLIVVGLVLRGRSHRVFDAVIAIGLGLGLGVIAAAGMYEWLFEHAPEFFDPALPRGPFGIFPALLLPLSTIEPGLLGWGAFLIFGLLAICAVVFVCVGVSTAIHGIRYEQRRAIAVGVFGILSLALGSLPYLLVGKLPAFIYWESRHQLLLPFGVALVVTAALTAFPIGWRPRAVGIAGGAVVLSAAMVSAMAPISMVADWHKQSQVIAQLAELDEVRAASVVVVVDEAQAWGFDARSNSLYEYTGWLSTAFGDASRLGVAIEDVRFMTAAEMDPIRNYRDRYGYADWDEGGESVELFIRPIEGASWWGLLFGVPSIELAVQPSEVVLPIDR